MEMHWSFECSNVLAPIVKAVAPHDHYRIWKKGSWLRMDSTITGMYMYTYRVQRYERHRPSQMPPSGLCYAFAEARFFLCFLCFCGHASG